MGNELKRSGNFSNERIFNLGMSAVGIAHDLNNFLCAIITYADMALEDSVDPGLCLKRSFGISRPEGARAYQPRASRQNNGGRHIMLRQESGTAPR
jgi:hypothetical protein